MGKIICSSCATDKIDTNCPECFGLGIKIAEPFNLTDELTPCKNCSSSIFGPGACPACGGKDSARCKTCKGHGRCLGCDPENPGFSRNRGNIRATVDQIYNGAARLIRAKGPDNCDFNNFEQHNRNNCGQGINSGDVVLHVAPENVSGISRRRGTRPEIYCTDHTLDIIGSILPKYEDDQGIDEESARYGWAKSIDRPSLLSVLKKRTTRQNPVNLGDTGHLAELKQLVAVPDKSREAHLGDDAHNSEHIKDLDFPVDIEQVGKDMYNEGEISYSPGEKCVLCGKKADFVNKTPGDGGPPYGFCLKHINEAPESFEKFMSD